MRARIYSIEQALFYIMKSAPAQLAVIATGRVPTTGWSDPTLTPFIYVTPPADGILDLDVTALAPAPGMVVLAMPTPVSASLTMAVPTWVRGVRVHASSNSATGEAVIDMVSTDEGRRLEGGGGSVPWPWAVGAAA